MTQAANQQMTAAAQAERAKLEKFKSVADLLQSDKIQNTIAKALPRHMTAERMIRVAMTALTKTPSLAECDQRSLVNAIIQSAELGLEPNTPLGHAYLVPFFNKTTKRKEIQLIPGYRGLIALARRSGKVQGIYAEIVYEKDFFEVTFGLNKDLVHKPALDEADRGKMVGAYAVAKFADGYTDFEYMSAVEIEKIRKGSAAGDSGPWQSHTGEMWRKTPIRRLSKRLPLSIEDSALQKAIEVDQSYDVSFDNFAPLELGEGSAPEVITEEQRIALVEAAKASGVSLTDAVQDAGFEMLAHITVDKYDEILAAVSGTIPMDLSKGNEFTATTSEPETVASEAIEEVATVATEGPKTEPKPKAEKPAAKAEPPVENFKTPEEALATSVLELAQIKSGGREMDARELLGGRNEAAVRKMPLEDLQALHGELMQK